MLHTLRYARSMKMQVKYKTVVAPTKMQTSAFLKYQLETNGGSNLYYLSQGHWNIGFFWFCSDWLTNYLHSLQFLFFFGSITAPLCFNNLTNYILTWDLVSLNDSCISFFLSFCFSSFLTTCRQKRSFWWHNWEHALALEVQGAGEDTSESKVFCRSEEDSTITWSRERGNSSFSWQSLQRLRHCCVPREELPAPFYAQT